VVVHDDRVLQLSLVAAEVEIGLQLELPRFSRPPGLERAALSALTLRLFAFEVDVRSDLEDPEVPRVLDLPGTDELLRRRFLRG
jgi:hypothetical protein